MLHEIYCEKFNQKKITFNEGLSVVLGTNTGDNSIGKSTFLLIVDYAFGGRTYFQAEDIIKNIGSHDIFFSFIFYGATYRFARNNIDLYNVWKCDEMYEKTSKISLDEYCNWLDMQYNIKLPALSFRDAVGRYIRVYGKGNCDEKHPLHYLANEKAEKACNALLKLFNEYLPLKEVETQAHTSEEALNTYKKAQSLKFIYSITKRGFEQNEKEIAALSNQIEILSSGLESGLLDVDAAASEQAVYIKSMLSRARRARSRAFARYDSLDENGNYKFSITSDSFSELQRYFPDANVVKIEEIEEFHKKISSIFRSELRTEKKALELQLSGYDSIISEYETQLKDLIENPKLSKIVLTKHAELLKRSEQIQKENEAYLQQQKLKMARDEDKSRLQDIRQKQFAIVSYRLNDKMSQINDTIYAGSYNAPVLDFSDDSYVFFTPDDTGTGIAYKGLVVFDLAVLKLTKLPVLVHDSVILKQISDDAIEQIIMLYSSFGKQVIIALDKQTSYGEKTTKLLNDGAVLKLAPGGEELFGRSWG